MFLLLSVALAALIGLVVGLFPVASVTVVASAFGGLPAPVFSAVVGSVAVFGLFIDFPVLFTCVGIILGWRLFWVTVRMWRILLELIPALG